ncbi:hypothetical protein [uncultured Sphingopyxis sp.]|jgi:type IV secretory pathway VirJ component|uniref:hypothetical protein n=1 Tax=uncultured Sphingopyxis sp. TaxID=310581 RepID=UPI002599D40D|nr:hypothetical protein [uncultured Sphingopyxis sp.]
MEIAPGLANWVLGGGAFGGFVGLVWVVLNFIRGSSKDATEAFTALAAQYKQQLDAERDECARRIGALEQQLREKAAYERELYERLTAIERQLAAQGNATAHFVRKLDDKRGSST